MALSLALKHHHGERGHRFSVRKLQLVSITFLWFWIFGLVCCWRNIFREEEMVELATLYREGHMPRVRIHNHTKSKSYKERRKRPPPPINLPLPVIVVGLPKAGTSSVFSFFQSQRFRCQHWYCCGKQYDPQIAASNGPLQMGECILRNLALNTNNSQKLSMLSGCGNYDVYAEINGDRPAGGNSSGFLLEDGTYDSKSPGPRIFLPQHFNLQQLHEEFPNATWILNLRDSSSWAKSVLKWRDLGDQFVNEYYMKHQIHKIPRNLTEKQSFLKTIYDEHSELIRSFVRSHPSHALIELNITDDEAGNVLADAFGLQKDKWVQKNRNSVSWRIRNNLIANTWWWSIFLLTTACLALGARRVRLFY